MDKIITSIEVQKNNPQRINIFINHEFAFGISKFVGAWLQVGQNLDEEKISNLKREDSEEVAFQKLIRFISYRPRSEDEIINRLIRFGFDDGVIEKVIVKLKEAGLAGDYQFAHEWVENRITFRPRSHKLLTMELRSKKIDEEIIQRIIGGIPSDEELALKAALKVSHKYETLDYSTFKKKLSGFLTRRGFNYSIVNEVCENLWEVKNIENDMSQQNEKLITHE